MQTFTKKSIKTELLSNLEPNQEFTLKDGAFLVEFFAEENSNNFDYIYSCKKLAQKVGFEYYSTVNWKKGNFLSNTGRKAKNHEQMVFFTKGNARSLKLDAKKNIAEAKTQQMDTKGLTSQDVADKLTEIGAKVTKLKNLSNYLNNCWNISHFPTNLY